MSFLTKTTGQAGRILRRLSRSEDSFLVLAVLAMVGLFTVLSPRGVFMTSGNLRNIALDTSQIVILAAAAAFVIIAAGLDLSVGSVVVFSAVVAGKTMVAVSGTPGGATGNIYPNLALGITAGILAALAGGAAWGFFNGFISVKWNVPPFITTLGTLGMALGVAQVITGGLNVAGVPIQLQSSFGGALAFGVLPWLVVVATIVVGILWMVLAKTRYGLRTKAIGSNLEAARRSGFNVDRHIISLYVLMGFAAGIVGVFDVARFNTATVFGHTQDNLLAIAAVVIGGVSLFGGRGRMGGVVIGAFIPTILRNGFVIMGVQPFWQNVAIGAFLIIAVYVDQIRRRRALMRPIGAPG